MIISKPHLLTKIEIFAPKYSDSDGWHVLLARYKVHHASSVMLVEFTKAKHLKGQRFCITRDKAQKCKIVSNGRIECYSVPFTEFEGWETPQEVRDIALGLFDEQS